LFDVQEFLVVTLTSLLRQMTTHHFESFVGRLDAAGAEHFLMELLTLFVRLIIKPVFPKHWGDMVILGDR
jgi:hypothetical protein